jgi:imidazoleglycerol phosphate synthase glutamine amidotransferase subunit HisH
VRSRNILATQFHPEKSGTAGLALLRRWAETR